MYIFMSYNVWYDKMLSISGFWNNKTLWEMADGKEIPWWTYSKIAKA
jgi:hypothetical protein